MNFNIYLFIYLFFFFLGGGGQKHEYILGYEDFVDIFGGHDKIGLVLVVISMYLRIFYLGKCTECGYLGNVAKFQIFLGCLTFLMIFGGK